MGSPLRSWYSEEEGDYEEDQSVEIPPTNVVQRMLQNDGNEKSNVFEVVENIFFHLPYLLKI